MSRLTLALALHNHQPVGNFPSIFEQAYIQAYEPMVAALERHPGVRVALHYSGPLLNWLQQDHPDLLTRIRALVARGQVEIMTGGYYEPILPAIPDRDKHGQIRKMTDAVKRLFDCDATGLWLAERVWEPHLPRALADAGVTYTIVDDTHFLHVGMEASDLVGHFITEEDGATVAIFPSGKPLRYRIPWAPVDDLMHWLRAQAPGDDRSDNRSDGSRSDSDRSDGSGTDSARSDRNRSDGSGTDSARSDRNRSDNDRILVMGDDGEKFGLWPGTKALCWDRGWVEAFFAALEAARDWLALMSPGEWVRTRPPRGRVYLPTASYDEMTEWALPAAAAARLPEIKRDLKAHGRADVLPFLQGGFWRHFMVKYPEINTLHKTMLRVSRKVWRMRPGPRREAALDHLWRAQCNCPYWHGVFGGIYLGHIRAANYRHLIEAERIADGSGRGRRAGAWIEVETADLDADGRMEVLIRSDAQVLTVDPTDGGSVVAWDIRAAGVNLVNVMTRRTEGYHEILRRAIARGEVVLARPDEVETIHTARVRVKEWGLERLLMADWYRRSSFLDHFLAPGGDPAMFARLEVPELGDFVNQPYEVVVERDAGTASVRLLRDGHIWVDGIHAPIRVEKFLTVPAGSQAIEVTYRVTNRSDRLLIADFAVETNWGVTGPGAVVLAADASRAGAAGPAAAPVGAILRAGAQASAEGVEAFTLRDDGWGFDVEATIPAGRLWVVPIEVVSASEAGYERTFQGASLLTVWPLRLAPGPIWEARLSFAIRSLPMRVSASAGSP